MTAGFQNILSYWRTSLADSSLGEGKFTQADRKRFISVPVDAVRSGVLPDEVLKQVFHGQTSARTMGIRFWPLVMARKSSHGAARTGGLPELVAPVVTAALVDQQGRMLPLRNVIARDVLSPLPSGEFAIGTVDALDAFLTATPLPAMFGEDAWQVYLGHCRQMVDAVCLGWPDGQDDYLGNGSGFIELAEDSNATVRGVLDLYDKLLAEPRDLPLLQ